MLIQFEIMSCVVKPLNAVDVSEAYSPPSIVEEAVRAGMKSGSSLDLSKPGPVLGRAFVFMAKGPPESHRAISREEPVCRHSLTDVRDVLKARGYRSLPHEQGRR